MAFFANLFWFILALVFCLPVGRWVAQALDYAGRRDSTKAAVIGVVVPVFNLLLLLVCTAMLSGQSYNPFLYYRF